MKLCIWQVTELSTPENGIQGNHVGEVKKKGIIKPA
jgi:hypothetical protein